MNKSGPIIIIEDDSDDLDLLKDAFKKLKTPNRILFFLDGIAAYEYLVNSAERPFLIISDINLPKLNGMDLRDKVHNNESLRLKCIPYLFFTTVSDQRNVIEAYSKSVQGFFHKPSEFNELVRVMGNIIEYWKDCHSPNVVV